MGNIDLAQPWQMIKRATGCLQYREAYIKQPSLGSHAENYGISKLTYRKASKYCRLLLHKTKTSTIIQFLGPHRRYLHGLDRGAEKPRPMDLQTTPFLVSLPMWDIEGLGPRKIQDHLLDRIWGIWGSHYDVPKARFDLLKGDYRRGV